MMPEIRFRDSEEKLIKEMEEMRHSIGAQWNDRCDECKGWGQGFYDAKTGKFTCLNCIAREKWLKMVGPPSNF